MEAELEKSDFSSYVFFGDESGDHSLTSVDATYPLFALSLCGFRKLTYYETIVAQFQKLKFDFFGHDAVVLHEHEIRKQSGDFAILSNSSFRHKFLTELSSALKNAPFHIFAAVIMKAELKEDFFPENPYSISLKICLQLAFRFLSRRRQVGKIVHFIFEKRGKKEGGDLELAFRRIVAGDNDLQIPFPNFVIRFSDKRTNSTGMQIADLTVRPIGLSILRPEQPNRAFEQIQQRLVKKKEFSQPNRGIYVA